MYTMISKCICMYTGTYLYMCIYTCVYIIFTHTNGQKFILPGMRQTGGNGSSADFF